jgi:hypothetical protein
VSSSLNSAPGINATALPDSGQSITARAQMYGLLLAGTMTGLPIPASADFDAGGIHLTLDLNDRAGVDAWAAFFGLEPASERDYSGQPGYSAYGHVGSAPTPWRAVRCYIEQAEVTR